MRKWRILYVISTGCLLLCLGFLAQHPTFSPATGNNQSTATIRQFELAENITGNFPTNPADAILENDALRSSRVFEQERNNSSPLAYSFFQANFSTGKDDHAKDKTYNHLITDYLDHIYPSHNFW